MSQNRTWDDPYRCPFCDDRLPSPGSGFVDHIDDKPECESGFESWRQSVTDDIRGGWTG